MTDSQLRIRPDHAADDIREVLSLAMHDLQLAHAFLRTGNVAQHMVANALADIEQAMIAIFEDASNLDAAEIARIGKHRNETVGERGAW